MPLSHAGEIVLALTGGGDWIPAMAGSLHPPFSLFLPEGKEKTGRARSKREKEVWSPPAMPEGSYFGLLFLFSLIQFPEMPV